MSQLPLLINLDDIKKFRSLSINIDAAKNLDPYINDAQEFDIRPLLGDALYLDLMEDFESSPSLNMPIYQYLFYGCTYTYNNIRHKQEGIKAVLAHFTYHRYCLRAHLQSTKTGFVVKAEQNSTPASQEDIGRLGSMSKSMAVAYQTRLVDYLNRNYTLYPNWLFKGERKRSQMRITAIGGNSSRNGRYCGKCGYLYDDCRCGSNVININNNLDPQIDLGDAFNH